MWWLVGCAGTPPVDPVRVTPVVEVAIERPERFLADPARLWSDADPERPPLAAVQRDLCINAPGVRNTVAARIHEQPEAEASRSVLISPCEDPSWCRWLRKRAVADVPTRSSPWWSALVLDCHDPESEAEIDGAGYEIRLWAEGLHPSGYDPKLGELIAQAMAHGDSRSAGFGLRALAGADGPEAERDLLALYRAVPARWKDQVALSLWGRQLPEARAALARVCARVDDPRCTATRPDPLDPDQVERSRDPGDLFDQLPAYEQAVADALQRCVASGGEGRRRCAEALLVHGSRVHLPPDDPELEDLRTVQSLGDRLPAKLVEAGVPLDPAETGRTVTELLLHAGQARSLDALDWWDDPVWLLNSVASLAGQPGLSFDVLPPSDEAPPIDGRTPRIALFAWDGTRRWRGLAASDDDAEGPSLGDLIGFANAVLQGVGSTRAVAVDRDGRVVIVAERAVLRKLADEHLLAFADFSAPSASEDE